METGSKDGGEQHFSEYNFLCNIDYQNHGSKVAW